jgi:hypothetical protein
MQDPNGIFQITNDTKEGAGMKKRKNAYRF